MRRGARGRGVDRGPALCGLGLCRRRHARRRLFEGRVLERGHSDTAFRLWAPPPACAAEAPGGGLVLTGSCDGLETAAAAGNPFQEGLLFSLAGASPPGDGSGALNLALADAYGGGANLTLALTASGFTLVAWTGLALKTLAEGALAGVCSAGSASSFDVNLTVAELEVDLSIACAGGAAGTPVRAEHLPQPWNYRLWGLGVSGAMRLGLSTSGGTTGAFARVVSIVGQSVLPPFMPLAETAPVTQLGLFGRPALGASQPRAAMGIIDVSAQPFAADATGVEDSTAALQDALDWCYQHHLVAFLPVGTYTVSDTLEFVQITTNNASDLFSSRHTPFVIQGERLSPAARASAALAGRPTRATLVLAPSSPGFTDPAAGKLVLFVHTLNPAGDDQPNVAFNNLFHSLDIVIGAGNAGAVGVGLRGAQGTSLEDVAIFAGDGAIGIMGLAGSGGAHSNVSVIGGRFGVDGRGAQPAPTLSALVVVNASCAGLLYTGVGPLALVGAAFDLAAGVPAIVAGDLPATVFPPSGSSPCVLPAMFNPQNGGGFFSGGVSAVDLLVQYHDGASGAGAAPLPPIITSAALVLSNAFFGPVATPSGVVALSTGASGTGAALTCGAPGCSLAVASSAFGNDKLPPLPMGARFSDVLYLHGVRVADTSVSNTSAYAPGAPFPAPTAAALLATHCYSARDFPGVERLGAGGGRDGALCAWDFGAVGDGYADDGAALQRGLDAAAAQGLPLILPRGVYNTSVGLVLPPGVALVGVARTMTVVMAALGGVTAGRAGDAGFPPALLFAAPGAPAVQRPALPTGAEPPLGSVLAGLMLLTWTASNTTAAVLATASDTAGARNLWRQAFAGRVDSTQCAAAVNPLDPPPPHIIADTPLVVVGSTDSAVAAAISWHFQVFYQDTDSNFEGPNYRHLLILGAGGGVRVYQLNTEHGMGDAETEVRGGGPVDFYGAKSERNFVVLWARNATRVRVWSYSGNAAAFAYNESASTYFGPAWSNALPSLFRFEACADCSLSNAIDMGMSSGGDVHKWSGMGVDPRVWHMVTWRAAPGPQNNVSWSATALLDRPALFTLP